MGSPILKHELVSGAFMQTLRATQGTAECEMSMGLWLCHNLWAPGCTVSGDTLSRYLKVSE